MARAPAWRKTLAAAYDAAELAHTYAEDGAFLTAADRLEKAAELFRKGHAQRNKAMGLDLGKVNS